MRVENVFLTIHGSITSSFGSVYSVLGEQQNWSSEEIRMPSITKKTFTAEQDHGRTDAPGRKVRTNVEDTKEVVVAARFMIQKVDQLRFIELGQARKTR